MSSIAETDIATAVGVVIACVLLVRWFRAGTLTPDPWERAEDREVVLPETAKPAVELCHRCFEPQRAGAQFYPKCGAATGPYNNLMPYEQIFSVGEVLRNGTNGQVRRTPLTVAGYLLLSFAEYVFFAPLYWYRWWKGNACREAELPGRDTTDVRPET